MEIDHYDFSYDDRFVALQLIKEKDSKIVKNSVKSVKRDVTTILMATQTSNFLQILRIYNVNEPSHPPFHHEVEASLYDSKFYYADTNLHVWHIDEDNQVRHIFFKQALRDRQFEIIRITFNENKKEWAVNWSVNCLLSVEFFFPNVLDILYFTRIC